MIKIPNQPVNFDTDPFVNPWITEAHYKQLVNQGDATQFQLQTSTQNNSENLLENSSFDQVFEPWQAGVGGVNPEQTGWHYQQKKLKTAQTAVQYGVLTIGSSYYIEFEVSKSVNGYVKVYLGSKLIAQKMAGRHVVYGSCEDNTAFTIMIVPFANTLQSHIVVDYVVVYDTSIANHRFTIEEMDGTVVTTVPVITNYLSAPFAVDTSVAQLVKSYLTMNIDWTAQSVPNGCYRIGVCDADFSTNAQCGVINSEFEAKTGVAWGSDFTQNNGTFGWDISLGSMTLTSYTSSVRFNATAIQTATLTQSVLLSGKTYNYSVQVTGSTGEDIDVVAGVFYNSHTTNGSLQTFTGTILADGTDLKLQFISTAGSKSMTIHHMRIEAADASLVPDYYSNPFELATDHDRTVVVNASTTNDAFGMEFDESVWSPRLRMKGYTAPSDTPYNNDRLSLETSTGNRKNFYLQRRKSRVLVVDQEPEFIHDWLSLLCGFDHVYVDNVEQFIDDDSYNPIVWDRFRIRGATEINISEKIQNIKKVRETAEKEGFQIGVESGSDNTDTILIEPIGNGPTKHGPLRDPQGDYFESLNSSNDSDISPDPTKETSIRTSTGKTAYVK